MAIGVLVLGKPGTGKSYSMKSFSPDEVKILSVTKPILPFRGKYEVVRTPSGRDIIREMKNTSKKNIVVDDFQYILGLPMMHRVSEKGWDKFNEIQQPYADVLETVPDLPDDVIVYFTSHTDTDNDGNTKIKTIGNALDKYIAVEGLFMIVLGTVVVNDNYYFATQNSGNDTLKSPDGMFPSKWIPNDLKYVEEKIRNYYYMDGAKTDEELAASDAEHTVADTDVKPERRARGGKASKTTTETATPPQTAEQDAEPEKAASTGRSGRTRKASGKTHDEVVAENEQKMSDYMTARDEALDKAFPGQEEVPFDEATAVMDAVPKPELETPPRRTRKERKAAESVQDGTTNTDSETVVLDADTYFYVPADDNYVMKHKGDVAPEGAKVITKEEFGEGVKRLAQAGDPKHENPVEGAMNPPESGRRTRRSAEQAQPDNVDTTADETPEVDEQPTGTRTRRVRRTR